jgi:hypothetical protein
MPLTNKSGLPQPIVEAVRAIRDDYNRGDADFTATELISPPKQNALKKKYADQIEEDVADLLRSMEGSALHYILERAGDKCPGHLKEQRHKAVFGPYTVSAQFDSFTIDGGVLTDWKRTTTYKTERMWVHADPNDPQSPMVMAWKPNREWAAQLNIQAEILRRAMGWDIRELQIGAFLRDWQPGKAAKDDLYPQNEVVVVPIPIVSSAYVEKYVVERCMLHDAAKKNVVLDGDDAVAPCSEEERWQDPAEYAVMKKGRKRALKRCQTPVEAQAFIAGANDGQEMYIEERPPGLPRRCMGVGPRIYCSVRRWCSFYQEQARAYSQQMQPEVQE